MGRRQIDLQGFLGDFYPPMPAPSIQPQKPKPTKTTTDAQNMCTLYSGDCRTFLPHIHDVDAVVTDPPYHLTSIVQRFGKEGSAPAQFGNDGAFARAARGFMGKTWDGTGVAFDPDTWRLVFNTLKPGAHLIAFGGTRTFHRMTCAIEDAGFEIRDCLSWLYGTGFPKSHNLDGDRKGWGTALKPGWEPIILARKPLIGTVAANVAAHGTGAINIDACRIESAEKWSSSGALSGGRSLHDYGDGLNNSGRSENHPLGRWPANVLHDSSEEVLEAFAAFGEKQTTKRCGYTTNDRNASVYGKYANSPTNPSNTYADTGTAARFFKECKWHPDQLSEFTNANDVEQPFRLTSELVASALNNAAVRLMPQSGLILADFQARSMNVTESALNAISTLAIETILNFDQECSLGSRPERRILSSNHVQCVALPKQTDTITITASLWTSNGFAEVAMFNVTHPSWALGAKVSPLRFSYSAKASKSDRAGSKHPTVKPLALMRWLCTLITPPGGHVLDPFAGSGTTLQAAVECGFDATGIELEAEYQSDIEKRIGRRLIKGKIPDTNNQS